MSRIRLLSDGSTLGPEGRAAFDWIIESRGRMLRPFEVLLHSPAMAHKVAELGHSVRYESRLADADRELVILATGLAHGCRFVWESHLAAAEAAGIGPEALEAIRGEAGALTPRQQALLEFTRELCGQTEVSDATFAAVRTSLDDQEMVELALTVGYYTMLGYVMSAFAAC